MPRKPKSAILETCSFGHIFSMSRLILSSANFRDNDPTEVSRFFPELGLSKQKDLVQAGEEESSSASAWTPPKDPPVSRFLHSKFSNTDQSIATGEGSSGSGWSDQIDGGTGLLAVAGYTVRKDGPIENERRDILRKVLTGEIDLPEWISENVKSQWSDPHSPERLQKIRNTLNVALGNQKGRRNPSKQAIDKWEADIHFLDEVLSPELS